MTPAETPRNAKLYLTGLVFSGIGDGIIMTVAQLYFIAAGFSSSEFGSIFMLKAIGTALITIPTGYLADRIGKRKVLIAGFTLFSFGMAAILFSTNIGVLKIGMLIIGLADASYVVLGPLYSSFFSHDDMDKAFGLQGFLSIISISVGSLLGFVPPMLVNRFGFEYVDAYWTMFAAATIFFIVRLPFYLMASREINGASLGKNLKMSRGSLEIVAKFVTITFLVTVGYEVFFSFFPLYLNTKFNAESDSLGLLFSMSWAASALSNIVAPKISSRLGTVKTITLAIALCVPFYIGMLYAPSLSVLAVLYLARRMIANLASPLGSSLLMKTIKDEEKATTSGINMTVQRLSSAFATWLGGWLIASYSIDAPIYVGTSFYVVYVIVLITQFGDIEEKARRAQLPPLEVPQ